MQSQNERYEHYSIFAIDGGERDTIAASRKRRWFETCLREAGIGFKPLCGSYGGRLERSYIVNTRNMPLLAGWYKGQDTVLDLSELLEESPEIALRLATLRDPRTGDQKYIGIFRPVTEETAHRADGWTYDPATGIHYVAA